MVNLGAIGAGLSGVARGIERARERELRRKEAENRTKFLQMQLDQAQARTLRFQQEEQEARIQSAQGDLQRYMQETGRHNRDPQQVNALRQQVDIQRAALKNMLGTSQVAAQQGRNHAMTDFVTNPGGFGQDSPVPLTKGEPPGFPEGTAASLFQGSSQGGQGGSGQQLGVPPSRSTGGPGGASTVEQGPTPLQATEMADRRPDGLGFTPENNLQANLTNDLLGLGIDPQKIKQQGNSIVVVEENEEQRDRTLRTLQRHNLGFIGVDAAQLSPETEDQELLSQASIVEAAFQQNTSRVQVDFGQDKGGRMRLQFSIPTVGHRLVPDPENPKEKITQEVTEMHTLSDTDLAFQMASNPSTMSAMAQSISDAAEQLSENPAAKRSFARALNSELAPALTTAIQTFEAEGIVERMADNQFALNPFADQEAPMKFQAAQDLQLAITNATSNLTDLERSAFKFLPRSATESETVRFFDEALVTKHTPLLKNQISGVQEVEERAKAGDSLIADMQRLDAILPDDMDEAASEDLLATLTSPAFAVTKDPEELQIMVTKAFNKGDEDVAIVPISRMGTVPGPAPAPLGVRNRFGEIPRRVKHKADETASVQLLQLLDKLHPKFNKHNAVIKKKLLSELK